MNPKVHPILSITILTVSLLLATFYRQNVIDWWFLRSYKPSSEIATLATNSFMSHEGRRIFYASGPSVEEAGSFSRNCQKREKSLVLGCFVQNKIHIFDIKDKRLMGVKEVTSAHEMLHAVYQRLSSSEKKDLKKMLKAQRNKVYNPRIIELIKWYENVEGGLPPYNEMHSIFGTEIIELDAELERYYSQFFENRKALVSVAENYEAIFTQLQKHSDQLLISMEESKLEIASINEQINHKKMSIESSQLDLDSLKFSIETAREQGFSTTEQQDQVAAYNSAVNAIRNDVAIYNELVAKFNSAVAHHNSMVKEYNLIVGEHKDLVKKLDSSAQEL